MIMKRAGTTKRSSPCPSTAAPYYEGVTIIKTCRHAADQIATSSSTTRTTRRASGHIVNWVAQNGRKMILEGIDARQSQRTTVAGTTLRTGA
jgi:hypothetical protein